MTEDIDWFKSWFNSNYYHLLYQNRSQSEANLFIENLVSKLKLDKNQKVLDLGCGKGRHSIKLSQYFSHVDGLDLSEQSIIRAREIYTKNIEFHIGDMRNFSLKNKYGYIFNLFTSFGYFNDISQNIKVLKCCHKQLNEGGYLLIDFLNPELIRNQTIAKETKNIEGIIFNTNKSIENNNVIKKISILDNEKKYSFQEKVQLLDLKNFDEMFNETGFKLISSFGDYHLKEFEKNSQRLILWAKKE